MQIQSSVRSNPGIERAIAAGNVAEPSVIVRTPIGNHDLLVNRQAYSDPSLRRLFLPIKSLAESAVTRIAPNASELVNGLSIVIDLSVEFASVVQESRSATLRPVDATDQLSKALQTDNTDQPGSGSSAWWDRRDEARKHEGVISFLASLKDDRAIETIHPLEHVLGQTPVVGDVFKVAEGIFQMLDSDPPGPPLVSPSFDPEFMEELRDRLCISEQSRAA